MREAIKLLTHTQIETASLDARILLQHVLGVSHERLLADDSLALTPGQAADYQALIGKRGARQPVAQLIGKREFYGREFKVTEHTLDPRPDSEAVIEVVIDQVRHRRMTTGNILDLGTGTGCLLLTLLKEYGNAKGVGVDISEEALSVAQENAERLGVQERVSFTRSHWDEKVDGRFDIIVANPPYIPTGDIAGLAPEVLRYEPKVALDGGEDGLDAYRAIIPQLPGLLAENGVAAFEIGQGQEKAVEKIISDSGLRVCATKQDLNGILRCLVVSN